MRTRNDTVDTLYEGRGLLKVGHVCLNAVWPCALDAMTRHSMSVYVCYFACHWFHFRLSHVITLERTHTAFAMSACVYMYTSIKEHVCNFGYMQNTLSIKSRKHE
jgi:hypothetical protein